MSRNTIRCQNPACRAPLARIHHTDRIDLLVERETIRWRTTRETAMSIAQIRAVKRLTPGSRGVLRTENHGRSA